jgi:two-component system sensor histidine kinase MtrB
VTGRAADLGMLHSWWRSSLRVRVITITMVLGTVLAALIGSVVFGQVAQGLVRQAVETATLDAAQQARRVQEQFEAIDQRDNSSLNTAAFETVNLIAPSEQDTRGVVLARALSNERDPLISTYASSDIGIDDVPQALREALDADSDNQQIMVTEVTFDEAGTVPSVLVGSRVTIPRAGPHDLVLVYPMQREQDTLDLVRQWFLLGGLGLMVLIGAMAWLATRLVTDPVGRAVEVSQQLARGELGQRLPVTGSGDELDRLATSFNTMADSLQSQIHQLETLSRLQQRFVSDVSHELRTPLTTIRMAGEVLHASRSEFSGPVARSAELLHEELDRFEDLLTELLEISRYDSGAAVLEVERVDLVGLVDGVVDALGGLVRHSGSEVRVTASSPTIEVEVDPRRVSRILRNLIGNALEHGEGRPVEVTVTASDDVVAVSVRDHGVGFESDQAEQVFERFWRADTARTRTTGGTGLGLAISLEDARLHGGWLQAAGAPGEGALFRLTLPRERGITISQQPPPPVLLTETPPSPPAATVAPEQDGSAAQDGPRPLTPSPSLPQEPS